MAAEFIFGLFRRVMRETLLYTVIWRLNWLWRRAYGHPKDQDRHELAGRAIGNLNKAFETTGSACLNDLYRYLDITEIYFGEQHGWNGRMIDLEKEEERIMWSNGAVVVIKRGDAAIADVLEKSCNVEPSENLVRDIGIMRVSHTAKIKKAMEDSKKYARIRKPTPKLLLYLEIGYAMIVYGINAVLEWIARPPKKRRKKLKAKKRRC